MSDSNALLVAQITDTHLLADPLGIHKGYQTGRSLQAVLRQVHRLVPQPDLLLLTGDLSQDETIESYYCLRDQISPLAIPTYWIPGNHDQDVSRMVQALSMQPFQAQKSIHRNGWHILLLDSSLPNCVDGELSPETLFWLDLQLQESTNPTMIALHHPPLMVGSAWMDRIGLRNRDAFFEIVDRHPHVKLVVCGHIHQELDRWRHTVHYLGTPSTCMQFMPDCDEFTLDEGRSPGFRLLWLYPDGRYETQVHRAESCADFLVSG
jgi:Icc protein